MSDDDFLEQKVLKIIKELGLETLSQESQLKLFNKMIDLILKRVVLKVHNLLFDKDREEFDKILDKGEREEIQRFLIEKIPDFQKIANQEISKLKREIKKHIKDSILSLNGKNGLNGKNNSESSGPQKIYVRPIS